MGRLPLALSVGPRSRWVIGALVAFALAAGGCGDEENEPPAGGGGTATAETSAEQNSKPAQEDFGEPLASRKGLIDGERVRLEIVELRRSGATTALNLRLTGLTEESPVVGGQVGGTFDNGEFEGEAASATTLDGVSLIDTKNRKRYLVARDTKGNCVCDGNLGSAFATRGEPLVLSATFGAPPEEVDAVDIVIPTFGTFKDVPIS